MTGFLFVSLRVSTGVNSTEHLTRVVHVLTHFHTLSSCNIQAGASTGACWGRGGGGELTAEGLVIRSCVYCGNVWKQFFVWQSPENGRHGGWFIQNAHDSILAKLDELYCLICKHKLVSTWVETERSTAETGTDETEGDKSCTLTYVSAGEHPEK